MRLLELIRGHKNAGSALKDVNQPVSLSRFSSGDFTLNGDVAVALGIAMDEIEASGSSPEGVSGYYLTDGKGVVNKLEVRNIPPKVANRIYAGTVNAGLGGFIETRLDRTQSSVGLPHPVNVFKRA